MGKFSGVLIASDFDNTLVYTEEALRLGLPTPPMSDTNRQAIEDFMAQGGIFSIATGRALPAFAPVWRDIPMNGPTVLFNGAAIYDFPTATYLYKAFLPEAVRPCVQQVLDAFPHGAARTPDPRPYRDGTQRGGRALPVQQGAVRGAAGGFADGGGLHPKPALERGV